MAYEIACEGSCAGKAEVSLFPPPVYRQIDTERYREIQRERERDRERWREMERGGVCVYDTERYKEGCMRVCVYEGIMCVCQCGVSVCQNTQPTVHIGTHYSLA